MGLYMLSLLLQPGKLVVQVEGPRDRKSNLHSYLFLCAKSLTRTLDPMDNTDRLACFLL